MNKNIISTEFARLDDREKEEYINDIINVLHAHISSDKDSTILKNFAVHTDNIGRGFAHILQRNEIQDQFEQLKKQYEEYVKSSKNSKEKERDFFKKINEVQLCVEEYILDAVYYSQLNMLSELYAKEGRKRRDKKEFLKSADENPKLIKVALAVDRKRRMRYGEVKEAFKLSDMEMTELLKVGRNYFNISKEKDHKIRSISLNATGKRFIKCVENDAVMVPQSKMDEVVVSNCEALMLASKASIILGIPCDINIIGVSASSERKVRYFYRQTISELIKKKSDAYHYRKGYNVEDIDGGRIYAISRNKKFI